MVEKQNQIKEKLNIKNNLAVTSIEKEKLNLAGSEEVLKFNFKYSVDYEPKVGQILLTGHILFMEDASKVKEIYDGWKKEKKIPSELAPHILNTILAKCNIKALGLTQEVNLPPHIKLPILKPK